VEVRVMDDNLDEDKNAKKMKILSVLDVIIIEFSRLQQW
jgi:hypothetical protein